MTGIPSFQLGELVFFGYPFYYYVLVVVLLCFLGCRMLVSSHRGQVLLAIREDALRTELLGYDIRARQLAAFVLAAVLAGISGLLYVQWGNYITPSQVGLLQAALPVIWVAVGGRDSLLAVAISTYALNWLNYSLSSAGNQYALVIIGRAAGRRDAVLPERHHRDAGARAAAARLARRLRAALRRGADDGGSRSWRPKAWASASAASSRPTRVARGARGRAALHHRPERGRQVDPLLAPLRHLRAGRRPHPAQGRGRHAAAGRSGACAWAWASPSRPIAPSTP